MMVPLTSDPTVVRDDSVVTAELTSVPLVGKVTEVVPDVVRVVANAPDVVKSPANVNVVPAPVRVLLAVETPKVSPAPMFKVFVPFAVIAKPLTVAKAAAPAPLTDHWASFKTRSVLVERPMVIVPVDVPVPISVAAAPEVLMLVVPVRVNPPVPCKSPEPELTPTATKAPALLTEKFGALM